MAGRPSLFETPEQLQAAIDDYFNPEIIKEARTVVGIIKSSEGKHPRHDATITGLAYHLGFESRQSFYDYEEKEQFSYIIKRARLLVEMGYESRLQGNNVAGSIFALKNMGWKDLTGIDHTSGGEKIAGFNYVQPNPDDNAK